ncbi:FAD/FMN-containing dehydrogenase [Methylohalomonas lacus]|uniref:Delta(24)-sterol reductase n=1 Tax=Methylohalomonas lacus TaxID=398773 RepID=A0AAE3L0Z5_9GAMM|nr:FAD-binding oxidoreductase [Methylohalomonas lacus]MCS3902860.1 FAD/FMN-containing dehydrogenase [Methylohalomonas lacus]
MSRHADKLATLRSKLDQQQAATVGLNKSTSNLFRDRQGTQGERLDLSHFNEVIDVDASAGWVDAEGMTTFYNLASACLQHQTMPAVVPELRSITLGGAATGVGIESTSFRHGLVHHNLLEMDILTADGEIRHCRPDNEHSDLFFGFPNSYGTLGYALRLRYRTLPVKPYVRLEHHHCTDTTDFFAAVDRHCRGPESGDNDFVDGVVFGRSEQVLTLGRFVDEAPYASDYTFEHIYYRSLRERGEDYLTAHDYLWRWDTDWFWCSKNVFAQHPIIRRLYGRRRLNSVTYSRIMRFNNRWGLTRRLNRLRGIHTESVIQDVDIPLENAPGFLDFLLREIGVLPIWVCPIGTSDLPGPFPLYPLKDDTLYINFGFWDVISTHESYPHGHFNRLIEREVAACGGTKSLYSESYYDEAEFWSIYNHAAYKELKQRYDPHGRFPDLYAKCVLRR